MSQIPQVTTSTRLTVPSGQIRAPAPDTGSGIAQGLQSAGQALGQFADLKQRQQEAERQNRLVQFETSLIEAEPQIKQAMQQAEPGQQEAVLESRFDAFRGQIEQTEDRKLRQEMTQRLHRKRSRLQGEMIRARSRSLMQNMEANLGDQKQALGERVAAGDMPAEEAAAHFEESVFGLAGAEAIPEAQKDEMVREGRARFTEIELNALTDPRGKAKAQFKADLEAAGKRLDDPTVQATLDKRTARLFSNRVQRGMQGIDEAIRGEGLGQIRQSWNQGLLGDEVDRDAVEAGVAQLNALAEQGLVGPEQVTDLAKPYVEAIAEGDPRTGPQKLAMLESVLSDEEGVVASAELRESIDRARSQLASAGRTQDAVDRQVAGLQTAFATGEQAPENTSPDAWQTFEQRMIDELGHDPAEVVSYMARHDAPLEGVRARLTDTYSGELRVAEGVRMQRELNPNQRRNLLGGMDAEQRILANVSMEVLGDSPLQTEAAQRTIEFIESHRRDILAAGDLMPGADTDFDKYDPTQALLGSGASGRAPADMQQQLANRFRFVAAQEAVATGAANMGDLNAQQIAERAASHVMQGHEQVFRNAPPLPKGLVPFDPTSGQRAELVRSLVRRGATGELGHFTNSPVPMLNTAWRNDAGEVIVPITHGGELTEFMRVGDQVHFIDAQGNVELADGQQGAREPEAFSRLRQQMIENGVSRQSQLDPLRHDPVVHGRVSLEQYSDQMFSQMRDEAMQAWVRQGHDTPQSDEEWLDFTNFFEQYARDVKGWPRLFQTPENESR